MTCEEVREQLAEHLLGTLPEEVDSDVRSHLRGCMSCRRELRALDEGASTFARAAHQVDPPEALRDRVLGVLTDEIREAPEPMRRSAFWGRRAVAVAAAVVLVGGTIGVAVVEHGRAGHFRGVAARYEHFLAALGGRDVRVGTLRAGGSQGVEGSVVMYDSERGQSWILVLIRAPGETGEASVTVSSPNRRIELHPMEFDAAGEASTWLVTANDISRFDRVRVVDAAGSVLAAGRVQHE
ncbi:MAG: zf-HC2 domain-containing protein [Actinomycetota bacterium]